MSDNSETVTLSGDVTNTRAAEVRDALLNAFDRAGIVRVNIDGIKALDITFLQTLLSAEKTAVASGKKMVFDSLPNVDLVRLANSLGLARPETSDESWPW